MSGLWTEFDKRMDEAFRQSNGKKVVVWGYGASGKFLAHYFRRKNRIIDVIIDDNANFPFEMHVFQSVILDELSSSDYFVICDFAEESNVDQILESHGYIRDVSYIWLRKWLGQEYSRKVSYYDWLDYRLGTDISEAVHNSQGDNLFYSYGSDYALVDVLDNFYLDDQSVFDFGFGKAGTLIMFAEHKAKKIGGVEYDPQLYKIGEDNLKKCGINNYELYNMDAAKITTEIDGYTLFYMYNPFRGETFKKVISNIEESYSRNPRRILFLYSGTVQHKDVVRNGKFRLVRKIFNDYWSKYTNIYVMDGATI